MTFDEFRQDHYNKWQHALLSICFGLSMFILFIELIIMYYFYVYGELRYTNMISYSIKRIIVPSGINLLSCLVDYLVIYNKRASTNLKNCFAVWNVFIICAVMAVFHNYFNLLLVATGIPFFLCTVFANRKLFNAMLIASIFVAALAIYTMWTDPYGQPFVYKITTVFCYVAFIIVCYVMCMNLVAGKEREIGFLFDSYKRQDELIHELKIDSLTQLYNRTALEESIASSISRFIDGYACPVIVLIDIDHFKIINDTYGHVEGDKVLIKLSDIIRKHMNGVRNSFRYGGEEFILMFDTENLDEIYATVKSIKDEFGQSSYSFAPGKKVTFSAGIAVYKSGMTEVDWFNAADMAMYKSKNNGRNLISYSD